MTAKKKKPRVAPNGLESWELDHVRVIQKVNEGGGIFPVMISGALSHFHIADPELAALFKQAYECGQRAQVILNESAPKGIRLKIGITIGGRNC